MEKYTLWDQCSLLALYQINGVFCCGNFHFHVSVPSLWFYFLCWSFCRNWSQQKHSWNAAEGLFIPVTPHHGWFKNMGLGSLCPSLTKSSHADSDTAPVSPTRSQVALLGTSSASWLNEPFHLKHSSSQTALIQSARPQEACSPKCSLLLHLWQLLINQWVYD